MKLNRLGIFGVISFLSYTAMVVFSPLAYPGYDWMSMAVSDLSAEGAPSQALAGQLNTLFGPCAIVSVMAVCVAASGFRSRSLKAGIFSFAAMEWICIVGYTMFPWVMDAPDTDVRNVLHLIVTALVVILSLASMILIAYGAVKEDMRSLSCWALACLLAMLAGPLGMALFPKSVFGIFERFSTFSAVVFNAVLGVYLFTGRFDKGGKKE